MKISEIIETANKRTENRGLKTLNLENELLIVIQDFCLDREWEWRNKTATFKTKNDGTRIYDLTAAGADDANIQDLEKLSAVTLTSGGRLDRVFDTESQADALDSAEVAPVPERYFPQPGVPTSVVLDPKPVAVNTLRVMYWACPGSLPANGTVPLVPAHLHRILVKGLERLINKYTLAPGDAKFQETDAEYKALLQSAR